MVMGQIGCLEFKPSFVNEQTKICTPDLNLDEIELHNKLPIKNA